MIQFYKVTTLKHNGQDGPQTQFNAKDDLVAAELAYKFAKTNKAEYYQVDRQTSKGWRRICIDMVLQTFKPKQKMN